MEATSEIKNHLSANMQISKKDIIIGNFLGGVAWGVGTVVGAVIIGAIILWLLQPFQFFNTIEKTINSSNSTNK